MKPIVILSLCLLLVPALPGTCADNPPVGYSSESLCEQCMWNNCLCYYMYHDDAASSLWSGKCLDCTIDIVSQDWPSAAADCIICYGAIVAYESICWYDSENNDDWATGENYCNENNIMLKILFMAWDNILDKANAGQLAKYVSDVEQNRIYKRLSEDDEINCWMGCTA